MSDLPTTWVVVLLKWDNGWKCLGKKIYTNVSSSVMRFSDSVSKSPSVFFPRPPHWLLDRMYLPPSLPTSDPHDLTSGINVGSSEGQSPVLFSLRDGISEAEEFGKTSPLSESSSSPESCVIHFPTWVRGIIQVMMAPKKTWFFRQPSLVLLLHIASCTFERAIYNWGQLGVEVLILFKNVDALCGSSLPTIHFLWFS